MTPVWLAVALALVCTVSPAPAHALYAGKRVLWVESYSPGYPWSDGVARGVDMVLKGTGVELKTLHMDTKNNPGAEFGRQAGERIHLEFLAFKPDIVLASDDNAQKYFVVPYLLGTKTPVVFCGVNVDASPYGYPAANVTGMVEVGLIGQALRMMSGYAKGNRVAVIAEDSTSVATNTVFYPSEFPDREWRFFLAKDFSEYQRMFTAAQSQADMLILGTNAGIKGWDNDAARRLTTESTRIPTASVHSFLAEFAVFTFSKIPEEQGAWMASTALRILDGESPADIPLAENEQADLIVNLRLAKAADIVLPLSVLKTATVIGREPAP
ncbi:ABC transporter substrate-binding protein [Desulfocurvus sp. DL9XJH121]